MKTFVDRIRQRWGQMTMLRLLVAIIFGITLADCVTFPLWSVTVGFVVMVGAAWVWRRRAVADIYVMAAAAMAAMMTMNIDTGNTPQFISRQATRPSWAIHLREKAEQRIEQMGLQPEVESLAKGVTIGAREDITPALRQAYTRSGAAHLLAVSGLHVGFIFFMIIVDKAWLATLRPVSFALLIIVSLFLGYIVASIVAWILSAALKIIIIIAIIATIIFLFSKK